MTHLITADQLAKIREALDVAKDCINPEVSFADEVVSDCREALSILDNLTEVEVVATFGHKFLRPTGTKEAMVYCDEEMATGTPLYGSKT